MEDGSAEQEGTHVESGGAPRWGKAQASPPPDPADTSQGSGSASAARVAAQAAAVAVAAAIKSHDLADVGSMEVEPRESGEVLEAEIAAMLTGLPQAVAPPPRRSSPPGAFVPRRSSELGDNPFPNEPARVDSLEGLPVLPGHLLIKGESKKDLPLVCHVVGCGLDLASHPEYYQRYRICKNHLKAPALLVDGTPRRFCQQCGRFHDLSEFDSDRRNCRARLQQHNSRRRKVFALSRELKGFPQQRDRQGQGPRERQLSERDLPGPAWQATVQVARVEPFALPLPQLQGLGLPPPPPPPPYRPAPVHQAAPFDGMQYQASSAAVPTRPTAASQQQPGLAQLLSGVKRARDAMEAGGAGGDGAASLASLLAQQPAQGWGPPALQRGAFSGLPPLPQRPGFGPPAPQQAPPQLPLTSILLQQMAAAAGRSSQQAYHQPSAAALQHPDAKPLSAAYPQLAAQVARLSQQLRAAQGQRDGSLQAPPPAPAPQPAQPWRPQGEWQHQHQPPPPPPPPQQQTLQQPWAQQQQQSPQQPWAQQPWAQQPSQAAQPSQAPEGSGVGTEGLLRAIASALQQRQGQQPEAGPPPPPPVTQQPAPPAQPPAGGEPPPTAADLLAKLLAMVPQQQPQQHAPAAATHAAAPEPGPLYGSMPAATQAPLAAMAAVPPAPTVRESFTAQQLPAVAQHANGNSAQVQQQQQQQQQPAASAQPAPQPAPSAISELLAGLLWNAAKTAGGAAGEPQPQ